MAQHQHLDPSEVAGSHPSQRSPSPENDIFSIETPRRENKSATTTQLDFDGLLDPALVLHEDLRDGCGGQMWPAGRVLARYLLNYHLNDLTDKSIIEIGAGGGLVGLAVAKACRPNVPVLITDQKPMLPLMEKNIMLNLLSAQVKAEVYNWGSSPPPIGSSNQSFESRSSYPDVVLAADCVYFEPAFPLLLQTLGDLIGPDTVCYFCFKKRRKADWRFIRNMQKQFECDRVVYKSARTDEMEGVFLFRVKKRVKA